MGAQRTWSSKMQQHGTDHTPPPQMGDNKTMQAKMHGQKTYNGKSPAPVGGRAVLLKDTIVKGGKSAGRKRA